jgi:serine/threonine-protein kinase RsbW
MSEHAKSIRGGTHAQAMSQAADGPPLALSEPVLRIELVSRTLYLCAIRACIGEIAKRHGFSASQSGQIVLAVDEALANIMKHGYEGRQDGRIVLSVYPVVTAGSGPMSGPGLKMVMDDWGRQVDPVTIKSRVLEDIRPGGLGVHIIKAVMDQAVYERVPGAGMRLTLVKHLASPAVTGMGEGVCCPPPGGDSEDGAHG